MRRLVAAGALVAALAGAGCTAIQTPAAGPVYRYSWVMLHDFQREGIQIGPKYDAAGAHWSIYWWVGCAPAYTPCTSWDYIAGDPITPGSVHWYAIPECEPGVWCPMFDGKIVARIPLPYPPPINETNTEVTTK